MLADDDLWRCTRDELVHKVQRLQHEKLSLLHDQGVKMKDVNQRLQTHLLEIRNLKEINKKLQDDNQELRDLCCFLDDDRQKYRKLSKEWQQFGRYTSSVIKTEVASHQTKFQDLSKELETMLKDNEQLKELVIYLDDERCSSSRDQGDGSSGNSDERLAAVTTNSTSSQSNGQKSPPNEEAMKYIQHLESRIELLESQLQAEIEKTRENPWLCTSNITQAMKVLEVHNSLDKEAVSQNGQCNSNLNSDEKLLLRELCNVAWKSLEEETVTKPTRPLIPQNSRV